MTLLIQHICKQGDRSLGVVCRGQLSQAFETVHELGVEIEGFHGHAEGLTVVDLSEPDTLVGVAGVDQSRVNRPADVEVALAIVRQVVALRVLDVHELHTAACVQDEVV